MYYNTNLATSDNQDTGNLTLGQILTAIQALSPSESSEVALLTSILAAFAPLASASNQATGNTTLSSILSALSTAATAANQTTANTALASILSIQATAALQTAGNASLASIDSKIGSSTAAITSVTQSPSSVSLLVANANRKGFSLYNDSGAKCYVAMAATSTTSAFSVLIGPNSGYEPIQTAVYKGAISAIWASGNTGAMRVTEFT